MHCPSCTAPDTKVIDSRLLLEGDSVRRRRRCESCEYRFTTYEKFQVQLPMLIKKDGRRESFNRQKIVKALKKACQKRPISIEQIEELIDSVESLMLGLETKEVPSKIIGQWIMKKLHDLDPVSYVRYASFYWNYKDIKDFVRTLENKENQEILKSDISQKGQLSELQ